MSRRMVWRSVGALVTAGVVAVAGVAGAQSTGSAAPPVEVRAEKDLPRNSAGDVPFTYGDVGEGIAGELDDPSVKDRDAGATREEREASRSKYENLSTAEALAIAKNQFRDEFTSPVLDATDLEGVDVLELRGENTALVRDEETGARRLLMSTDPLQVRRGTGMSAVDLGLRESGDDFVPSSPSVLMRIEDDVERGVSFTSKGFSIGLEAAADPTPVESEDRVFYANARTDADFAVVPRGLGAEVLVQARSSDSPEEYRLLVDLPSGGRLREAVPDEPIPGDEGPYAINVVDGDRVLGSVQQPIAYDAEGRPVRSSMRIDGDAIVLRVRHRGEDVRYPVLADPEVYVRQYESQPATWQGWRHVVFKSAASVQYGHNPYFGSAFANGSYGPGLYLSMPTNNTYFNGDFAELIWQAPSNVFLTRARLNYVSHSPFQSNTFHGITNPANSAWESPVGYVNQAGGQGPNPFGPANFAFSSATHDFCYSSPNCNAAQGAISNQLVVGLQANNPSSTYVQTGANKAVTQVNSVELYLGDRSSPVRTSADPVLDNTWYSSAASVAQPVSITGTDLGLGMKSVVVTGASTVSGTSFPGTSSACTGHVYADPCPKGSTTRQFSFTVPEGDNTVTARIVDAAGNQSSAAVYRVRRDRTDPTAAAIVNAPARATGPIELSVTGTDAMSGIKTARLLVDGQQHGDTKIISSPTAGKWDGTLPFDPGGVAAGARNVQVEVVDQVNKSKLSTAVVIRAVDTNAPTIEVTGGLRSSPLTTGRSVRITGRDLRPGVKRVKLELQPLNQDGSNNGAVQVAADSGELSCSSGCPAEHTILYTLPDGTPAGRYRLTASVREDDDTPAAIDAWEIRVVAARDTTRKKLGLEQWFELDSTDTGGGSTLHVNGETGNVVWHDVPIVNPGRGLSSVVNLTYNSQDRGGLLGNVIGQLPVLSTGLSEDRDDALGVDLLGSSYRQAGVGFSLAVSGPNRVNEPLGGVAVGALTEAAEPIPTNLPGSGEVQPRILLTDADGTRHDFQWDAATRRWNTPPGVNMRLRYTGPRVSVTALLKDGASLGAIEGDTWWELTRPDGIVHSYDRFGYLQATRDRNENTIDYVYEAINQLTGKPCPAGTLLGRILQLTGAYPAICIPRLKGVAHLPAGVRSAGTQDPMVLATTKLQLRYPDPAQPAASVLGVLGDLITRLIGTDPLANLTTPPLVGVITGRQTQISEIEDNAGRKYQFTYDADGYLKQFVEAAGSPQARTTSFDYEAPASSPNPLVADVRQLTRVRTGSATDAPSTQIAYGDPLPRPGVLGVGPPPRPAHTVIKRGGGVKNYLYAPAVANQPATHDVYEQTLNRRYLHRRTTLVTGDGARRPTSVVQSEAQRSVDAYAGTAVVTPAAGQFSEDPAPGTTTTGLEWTPDHKVRKLSEPGRETELSYISVPAGQPDPGMVSGRKVTGNGTTHEWLLTYQNPDLDGTGPQPVDTFVHDTKTVKEPGRPAWDYTVSATGNVTKITDPTGAFADLHYTTGGVVDYEISFARDRTDYSGHDPRTGEPTVVKDPLIRADQPRTSWYRYDKVGNLVAVRDPRGTPPVTADLDPLKQDGLGVLPDAGQAGAPFTTYLKYDEFDRVITESVSRCSSAFCDSGKDGPARLRRVTSYSRDNNVETTEDFDGKKTDPDYDSDGVLVKVSSPGQSEALNSPSSADVVQHYVHDKAQRLIAKFGPRATTPSPADLAGVLGTQENACSDGGTRQAYLTRYCLDYRGLPVAQIAYGNGAADQRPGGATDRLVTAFGYDARGNRAATIDPARIGGGPVSAAVASARTAATSSNLEDLSGLTPRPRASVEYDELDRARVEREYPLESGAPVRKLTRVFEPDGDLGVLKTVGETDDPDTAERERAADERSTTYGYDAMGRMLQQTDPLGRTTCWARRGDGQVVAMTTPRGAALGTSACGNRQTATGAYTTRMSYDEQGALKERTIPYRPDQYGASRTDVPDWKVSYLRDSVGNPVGIIDGRANASQRSTIKSQYTGVGQPSASPHLIRNSFLDTGEIRSTTRPSWWDIDWAGAQPNPDPGQRYPGTDAADTMVGAGGPQLAEHQGPQTSNAQRSQSLPDKPESLGKTDFGEVSTQAPQWLPKAGLTHFRYHPNGWLEQISDATQTDQRRRTIDYYPSGLPSKVTWPLSGAQKINHRFAYNQAGSLLKVNEDIAAGDAVTTTYGYDGWERRLSEDAPGAAPTAGVASVRELTGFVYDDNSNLSRRITPRPNPTNPTAKLAFEFKYTSLDELRQEINPDGEDWEYEYDRLGQLVREIAPGESDPNRDDDIFATTNVFDRAGQLTHTIAKVELPGDQPGQTDGKRTLRTEYGYDQDGNRTHVLTPGSSRTADLADSTKRLVRTDYDGRGLTWRTRAGRAPTQTLPATGLDEVVPTTDAAPSGDGAQQITAVRTSVSEFDANGNLRRTVNPKGINASGFPATTDDGSDSTTNLQDATRNAQINLASDEDLRTEERLAWDFKRDAGGDIIGSGTPDGRYQRLIEYDNGSTDPDGRVGWPTAISLPAPVGADTLAKTAYEYNDQGWVTAISETRQTQAEEPVGQQAQQRVEISYDDRGHQSRWKSRNSGLNDKGRDLSWTYYPNGQLRTRTASKTVRFDSNTDGQINSEDQFRLETRTYDYGYNENRSLVHVRDRDASATVPGAQDRVTTIGRDPAERESTVDETWRDGNDVSLTYNQYTGQPASRFTSGVLNAQGELTGAKVKRTEFFMDSQGREMFTKVTPATGNQRITRTLWSDEGEMLQRRKANGTTDRWSWTALGEKIRHDRVRTNDAGTTTTRYEYDQSGQRTRDERGTHVFNGRGQLVWWTRGSKRPDREGWVTAYLPDATGQVWWRGEWASATPALAAVDKLPTVESMLRQRSTIPTSLTKPQAEGGIDPEARTAIKTLELQRFSGERLTSSETLDRTEDVEGHFSSRYLYDDSGNVQRIYAKDLSANPPPPASTPDYPFAPEDCEKDDLAAEGAKTTTRYCYDEFNRLIAASGFGTGKPELISYDGLDRRDRKTTKKSGNREVKRDYSYLGTTELLIDEQVGTSGLASDDEDRTTSQDYDYDSQGDRLGQQTTTDTGDRYRTYDKDANGSVTGLEQANGAVADDEDYVYDPYGALDHTAPSVPQGAAPDSDPGLSDQARNQPFRFEGFYYDSGVKTYDMHARHYRPESRRFLSRDQYASGAGDQTLQADPLTQNRYAFAGGNPVTNIEFDGHAPCKGKLTTGNSCPPVPTKPGGGSKEPGASGSPIAGPPSPSTVEKSAVAPTRTQPGPEFKARPKPKNNLLRTVMGGLGFSSRSKDVAESKLQGATCALGGIALGPLFGDAVACEKNPRSQENFDSSKRTTELLSLATLAFGRPSTAPFKVDLPALVTREKVAQGISPGRNGAVIEYGDGKAVEHIVAFSERGVGHAERLAAKELAARGVAPSAVRRIYSQLEPCALPGGYCGRFLAREFPNAEVTFTFPYPGGSAGAATRRASVEAMRKGR